MSSGYYENKQRKALKKAYERYYDLTKEEKNKNCQYGCKRYKTLYEDEKQ